MTDLILNSRSSVLLLGPRQTGKSTLIKNLGPDLSINLANEKTFLEFSSQPGLLLEVLEAQKPKTIFIDEIQRLPSLLNTIQTVLDENPRKFRFFLTGSSARKLRRGSANLLPGRVIALHLAPLSLSEIGSDFHLNSALSYGLLPGIVTERNLKEKELLLSSYGATYLKEEVQAEALTKNIEGFSRFLFVVASKSGQFLDFAKLGSQAGITQKTATRFFEILEDSLIVFRLDAYSSDSGRRLIKHPKFYFFDIGVLNSLMGTFRVTEDRKGSLFEGLVIELIRNALLSNSITFQMSTYRSTGGAEVDLILTFNQVEFAIEIKSSGNIGKSDLRGLSSFEEISRNKPIKMIIYNGDRPRKLDGVSVLPIAQALRFLEKYM